MKRLSWTIAVAGLSFVLPAFAQALAQDRVTPPSKFSTLDPEKLIYRTSGVRDTGSAGNVGTATSFHCTNLSKVSEKLRIRVLNFNGGLISDLSFTIASAQTFTASTHGTAVFSEDSFMSTGKVINQGVAAIISTTVNMICSAMIVDAASATPNGFALHLVRFNALPGTME